MKTQVLMKRNLFGMEVLQQSKTEFFSATDLVKAGNKYRIINDLGVFNFSTWLNSKSTKLFISELKKEYGKVIIKGKKTWVHPFLFIDLALSISPKLKIEAYKWLYDELLKSRNSSGDSYKLMCGSLWHNQGNKQEYQKVIIDTANKIKYSCGVDDWQCATQEQLEKRDKIHNSISLLSNVLKNNNDAIRLGILEGLK